MLYSCADWLAVDPTVLLDDDLLDECSVRTSQHAFMTSDNKADRSPRGCEELQRDSFSLASSIEEFNAMIEADMASGWSLDEGVDNEVEGYRSADFGGLHERLGARFFATGASGSVTYGWTPFRAGEFQFASVAHSSSSRNSHSARSSWW